MEYHICDFRRISDLIEEVNRLIGLGWRPQGGVSIALDSYSGTKHYAQAMVKPASISNDE